jgi:hypothetical protein
MSRRARARQARNRSGHARDLAVASDAPDKIVPKSPAPAAPALAALHTGSILIRFSGSPHPGQNVTRMFLSGSPTPPGLPGGDTRTSLSGSPTPPALRAPPPPPPGGEGSQGDTRWEAVPGERR